LNTSPGGSFGIAGEKYIVYHCEHFALGQHFIGYLDPSSQRVVLKPRQPYVYGLLLEQNKVKAVIHGLPVCDYVGQQSVPLHTLYMFTYFSQNGKLTYQDIGTLAINRMRATEANTWLLLPHMGWNEDHWYNLIYWVERGLLYWVEASDAEEAGDGKSILRTNDVANFPFTNIDKTSL